MERGVLLNMRRAILILLLALLTTQNLSAASNTLVLVVGADSKVPDLDSITIRKLFLGFPVLMDGSLVHPVRNRSDAAMDPIYLQEVVAMSQSAYERQILMGVNRQGWLRPAEVFSTSRALEILYSDPNAVTFMWLKDVVHDPKLRVVRILWSD
jgi:hypothetical protein